MYLKHTSSEQIYPYLYKRADLFGRCEIPWQELGQIEFLGGVHIVFPHARQLADQAALPSATGDTDRPVVPDQLLTGQRKISSSNFIVKLVVFPLIREKTWGFLFQKIVAASRGMHVSPAKHSFGKCDRKVRQTDRQTDGRTTDKVIPMCRYASQATQKRARNPWEFLFQLKFLNQKKSIEKFEATS